MILPVDYSLLCEILQELIYSFWERIAADALQPDLSKGLQPYITQMLGLHKAGGILLAPLHPDLSLQLLKDQELALRFFIDYAVLAIWGPAYKHGCCKWSWNGLNPVGHRAGAEISALWQMLIDKQRPVFCSCCQGMAFRRRLHISP